MFIFYGWGTDSKALDVYGDCICTKCNSQIRSQVIVQYSYFSLFFIKIIKWNKHYFLQCPYCGNVAEIDKQTYLNMKNGVAPQQQAEAPQAEAEAKADPFGNEFNSNAEAAAANDEVKPDVPAAETPSDASTEN